MLIRWLNEVKRNAFFALCAFPMLMGHWVSMISIVLLISSFSILIASRDWRFDKRLFLSVSSIVWVYIIWLLFSHNLELGFKSIQVKLLLILLPLIFSFKRLRLFPQQQTMAFFIFSFSAAIRVISTNFTILLKGFTHPVGFEGADFTYSYRIALEYYSGLHPTYYCAIVYTAALVLLYFLFNNTLKQKWQVVFAVSAILICSIGGVMAASRATFIAFLAITIVMIIQRFYNHPKRWYALGILVGGIAILFFTPTVQNRLKEMNAANMQAPQGNNDNGTNVRSGVFACDVALLKQHWLMGVGTGNIQHALNECLSKYDTHVYKQFNYNTHNEYLNAWLTCGILGFMIFIGCLLYSIVFSVRAKHWLHLYFVVFMAICFVTENYLDRQMGVTLFAVMQTLFFFKTLRQQ